MAQEQFFHAASKPILELIERAGEKAGFGRGRAFEDFLVFYRCNLAGRTMEEEYLAAVHKGYERGPIGDRGIDVMTKAGQALTKAMMEQDEDILGDIFTGGITYGERGQFFTPQPLADLMAALVSGEPQTGEPQGDPRSVNDPTSGSGRFLLAMAKKNPFREFVGQDVDHRCAQMTAINMALRGWAVWQNTLSLECYRVYRIGMFFNKAAGVNGLVQDVPIEQSPFDYEAQKKMIQHRRDSLRDRQFEDAELTRCDSREPPQQLDLF